MSTTLLGSPIGGGIGRLKFRCSALEGDGVSKSQQNHLPLDILNVVFVSVLGTNGMLADGRRRGGTEYGN